MLDLSLRDLEYVLALEAERNFSRAAERLHMAQPALSQAILRIERRLGVRLFERTSRHVVPTEAGLTLCAEATEVLVLVERAVRRTQQVGQRAHAVHVHVSEPSLQTPRALLSAIRAQHPDLGVHQTTLPHDQVVDELRRGTLTLAIGDRISSGGIHSDLVRHEPVGVLMVATHPLAAYDAVRLEDLAEYPLVSIDERLSGWNAWVTRLLAEHGLTPTWSTSTAFGVGPGTDLLDDGHTLFVCIESIGTESPSPFEWRPLEPASDVGWYVSWHDTPPPAAQALDAIRSYVVDAGWHG